MRSNDPGGSSSRVRSWCSQVRLRFPPRWACTSPRSRSVATTLPSGQRSASHRATVPVPAPSSRQRQSGRICNESNRRKEPASSSWVSAVRRSSPVLIAWLKSALRSVRPFALLGAARCGPGAQNSTTTAEFRPDMVSGSSVLSDPTTVGRWNPTKVAGSARIGGRGGRSLGVDRSLGHTRTGGVRVRRPDLTRQPPRRIPETVPNTARFAEFGAFVSEFGQSGGAECHDRSDSGRSPLRLRSDVQERRRSAR